MDSPMGYILLSLGSLLLSFIIYSLNFPTGIIPALAILGLFTIVLTIINPKYGFFINLFFALFLRFFVKFNEDLPFGIITNIFPVLTFFSIILQKLRTGILKWTNYKNPVTYAFLFYIVYYFLEILNPEAHSILGWAQALREVSTSLLLYFITLELCTSRKFLKEFLVFWLISSCILGLYGMFQEYFGFLPFELNWVNSNSNRLSLILVDGVFRKFSAYTSPTTFGIGMSMAVIFSSVLFGLKNSLIRTIFMVFGIIVMLMGMAYSGTRTADVMLPTAFALYLILNLDNFKLIAVSLVPIFAFVVLLVAPINGNYTLNRFRSAFSGSKDISFNVRDRNRKLVQPYIYEHPIGGGISTTGGDGIRFNPGHTLAGFPTDSGYLKTTLEQGYIGLLIIASVYWIILRQGLRNYFKLKDIQLKTYSLGILLVFFALIVGNYSQDAIAEIPNAQLFYILSACLVKLPEIELN